MIQAGFLFESFTRNPFYSFYCGRQWVLIAVLMIDYKFLSVTIFGNVVRNRETTYFADFAFKVLLLETIRSKLIRKLKTAVKKYGIQSLSEIVSHGI